MKPSFIPLILSVFILSNCTAVGVATGIGAHAGLAAAQEGGISRAANDLRIQARINEAWFHYDVEAFSKLDMTVNQGRVLLTGVVQNPEHRVEAVRLAWQPQGVKQVINEITVAEGDGIIGFARDAWISARLRSSITFDKDVQSINYTIDTVQKTIYLMGVAQSQAELNRVIETARTIPDVRRVVSYVKLAGEQVDDYTPPPSSGAPVASSAAPQYADDPYTPMPVNQTASQATDSGPIQITPVEKEDITWR